MNEPKDNTTATESSSRCYLTHRVFIRALDGANPSEWLEWCDFESAEQAWFAVRQEREQDAKFPPQRYRYKVERIVRRCDRRL